LDGEELTVYDPIERTSAFLCRPNSIQFDFHNEFRVFVVQMLSGRINQTGEWTALPSPSPHAPEAWALIMRDGRFAYWKSNTRFVYQSQRGAGRTGDSINYGQNNLCTTGLVPFSP
jgi:hypothetical protein